MLIVVSYDVSTTSPQGRKRLRRMAKACSNFGQRVQNSVFECHLDPTQWAIMKIQLLDIMERREDSLRVYFLGANWRGVVEHYGTKSSRNPDDALLV